VVSVSKALLAQPPRETLECLPHALTEMNRIKQQVQDRCATLTFPSFCRFM
jgi:hypothetical protein